MVTHAHAAADAGTRARTLAIARELFAENGYAGTSIADIADRLGVSKAAVYYHFRAKADLLQELLSPMFEQMQQVLSAPRSDSRTLIENIVEVLAAQRGTIGLVAGDPSVAHELKGRTPVEHLTAVIAALAGPQASQTRRLRARCAIGAIHAAVVGPIFERHGCASGSTPEPAGRVSPPAEMVPMTRHERRVVVDAALAALGE